MERMIQALRWLFEAELRLASPGQRRVSQRSTGDPFPMSVRGRDHRIGCDSSSCRRKG